MNSESLKNKGIVKDMIRRFSDKTDTYEILIKFQIDIDKTDESSISLNGNTPGEIVDQKERRRFVRKEMRDYEIAKTF